jgi:TctA family transporter
MDVNAFVDGFALVTEPQNLLYCLLGVLIGMLIGVLPGLGPAATIAILLPITYTIDPVSAIIMLAGIYYGAQYGGTITSVLLRLPGEASSVVTVFDGFALAKQGKAGTALGISAIGSFVGATVSIVGLTLVAPLVAEWALDFGPPEYAALALLGVLLVASIGSGSARTGSAGPSGTRSTSSSSATASTSSSSRWACSGSGRSSTTSRSGTASRTCRRRCPTCGPPVRTSSSPPARSAEAR